MDLSFLGGDGFIRFLCSSRFLEDSLIAVAANLQGILLTGFQGLYAIIIVRRQAQ